MTLQLVALALEAVEAFIRPANPAYRRAPYAFAAAGVERDGDLVAAVVLQCPGTKDIAKPHEIEPDTVQLVDLFIKSLSNEEVDQTMNLFMQAGQAACRARRVSQLMVPVILPSNVKQE